MACGLSAGGGGRRRPPPRHRRDARTLEELPKEDKEFDPFATLRARGGAGTDFVKGEASATRRGMSPPAGSTAPRPLVEASLLLPRRPQRTDQRAV